ncbi:hypothetical protein MKK67_20530 [Methylobacterium sp. J-072]|uniref:hypothetical protein n=1 Tax=Methylobacterium sp. J-072 TaxID=2836651 RepID=UPI001FBBD9C0|nr:hypothetical protein [Methylobacterium sp. J-072]MCJ2094866.1 hypothetical protein [Methylobacterium sp. J-072]
MPADIGNARPDHGARPAVEWALGGFGCLVAVLVPFAILALPQSEVVAVVGPPGSGAAESVRIIAAAGGTVLNRGGPDNVLWARSDREGFTGRLYAAGARLVLDGHLSEGCGPSASSTPSPNATPATAWNSPR